jgi:hypothetical protein
METARALLGRDAMTTAELARRAARPHVSTLADVHTSRLALLAIAVASLLTSSSGCSLIFVDGPPDQHRQLAYFDCTSSNLAPVVDMVMGGAEGIAVLGSAADTSASFHNNSDLIAPAITAAAFVASGIIGFRRVAECKEAKNALAMRAAERSFGPSPGLPPAVDPWLTPAPANAGGWRASPPASGDAPAPGPAPVPEPPTVTAPVPGPTSTP